MPNILSKLDDVNLSAAIDHRWQDSTSLWSKMENWGKKNRMYWRNEWEDENRVARKTSRAKDNRIFLSVEHDVNILTARPAKPIVLAARPDDPDSAQVAEGLQWMFLDLYRQRQVKKKLKRGIRKLHFDRLICLYPFWNNELNDVDVRLVNPRKVRIPKQANNEQEAEWMIEEIEESISKVLGKFQGQEEEIINLYGFNADKVAKEDPQVKYRMFWTSDFVAYQVNQKVIKKMLNPTWDWDGLAMSVEETTEMGKATGIKRRPLFERVKKAQSEASRQMEMGTDEETGQPIMKRKEGTFFYNHFNNPRKPYIFGTIFEDDDGPFGSTDLIHQAAPLQDNVNRRKRQIDDNAEEANGIYLFDSKSFTKEDVQRFSGKPGARLYGSNIANGFKRDAGRDLPAYVFTDLEHSIREIDNIFATQGIVRGEREGKETAAGRALLREAALERREEIIDLIDFVTLELYNWWFQLMKINYTEPHYAKPLGLKRAQKAIELTQDDFEDGVDIHILPGQIVPDDKIFRQEKALEEVQQGLISPIDYHRIVGKDDPDGITKRLIMFKMNPASLVSMSPEDMNAVSMNQNKTEGQIEDGNTVTELEAYLTSPEFQQLPPEQQKEVVGRVREKISQLKQNV